MELPRSKCLRESTRLDELGSHLEDVGSLLPFLLVFVEASALHSHLQSFSAAWMHLLYQVPT
eukprot:235257-Heterocapsa_arctica.AAC.1